MKQETQVEILKELMRQVDEGKRIPLLCQMRPIQTRCSPIVLFSPYLFHVRDFQQI